MGPRVGWVGCLLQPGPRVSVRKSGQGADKTKLVCANQNAWLLRKGERTSWDPDQFQTFFDELGTFWNDFS